MRLICVGSFIVCNSVDFYISERNFCVQAVYNNSLIMMMMMMMMMMLIIIIIDVMNVEMKIKTR